MATLTDTNNENNRQITLQDFIETLPSFLAQCKHNPEKNGSLLVQIQKLFESVRLEEADWERYAYFDPAKNYTRNLVATDNQTFTLLVMCWTAGHLSPIHDHPCDGCWVRVLKGSVNECRYVKDQDQDQLRCTKDETYRNDDGVLFIEDSLGYHKMGSASSTEPAVTMHLYSPPFEKCLIWNDEKQIQPSQMNLVTVSSFDQPKVE